MNALLDELGTTLRDPRAVTGIVAGALAIALLGFAMSSAPIRTATRLGPRGLRRQRAMHDDGLFAAAEPIVRWLGTRLSGTLPPPLVRSLDERLTRAGDFLGISPEEYVTLTLAGGAAGAALGATVAYFKGGTLYYVLGGLVAGLWLLHGHVDGVLAKRAREITHGLPYVVDLLALGMTAGLDFTGAVRQVVSRSSNADDALTQELERLLQELALGHTRRHVLTDLGRRTAVPVAVELVQAVVQAEERGNPLVEVLSIQAQVSRQKRSAAAEEAAAKAAQAMTLPLMLLAASTLILLAVPMILKVLSSFEAMQ